MSLNPVQSSTPKPSLIIPAPNGKMGFKSVIQGFFKNITDRVKTIGQKRFDQPAPISAIVSPKDKESGYTVIPITPLIPRMKMQDLLSLKGSVKTVEGFRVI